MRSDERTTFEPTDDGAVVIVRVLIPGKPAKEHRFKPGRYFIGRAKDADVPLVDVSVSRRHLELTIDEDGRVQAKDLGSSTGSYVNGRRIGAEPMTLPAGAAVALGDQRLEVNLVPRAASLVDPFGGGTRTSFGGGPSVVDGLAVLDAIDGTRLSGPAGGTMVEGTANAPMVFRSMALSVLGVPLDDEDMAQAERASLLADLPEESRARILQFAERIDIGPGQSILRVGDQVEELNIVLRGEVQLRQGDRSTGTVQQGGALELAAVLRGGRATLSASTEEGATLLRVEGGLLREVLQQTPEVGTFVQRIVEWPGAERLRDIMLEYGVPRPIVVSAIGKLTRRVLKAKERLNQEGERANALWILDDGNVAGWKSLDGTPALLVELAVGSLFGGAEVLANRPLSVAFEAATDSAVLEIDAATLKALSDKAPELRQLVEALGPFAKRDTTPPPELLDDSPPDEDDDAPPLSEFMKGKSKAPRGHRRVHIRQHDEMDCGAACLAMMANAYGRRISLAYYRSLVHVTREGASMWSLVRAARQTGFDVIGIQSSLKGISGAHLPAILLLQYHFVVLYAVTKKHAIVGDPAIGMRKIPVDEFKKVWSGMALLFRPTPRLDKHPESASGYMKYRVLLRSLFRPLVEIVAAAFLVFALGLVTPLITQVIFDRVIVREDATLLNMIMIGAAVVLIFSQTAGAVRSYLTGYVANKFDTTFSSLVYRHVLKLPLNYFMVRRVGDFLTRLREIGRIRKFLTGDSLTSIIQIVSVGIYLFVLYLYDVRLGAIALGLIPLIVAASVLSSGRLEKIMQEGFPARAKAQGLIVEQVRSLDTIKSLSAELPSRWRWEEAFRDNLQNQFRMDRVRVVSTVLSSGLESLATTAMLFLAARMAIRGQLSVGKVIATGQFVSSIFGPVRELAGRWTSLQETKVALDRVDDIITAAPEPGDDRKPADGEKLSGDIEFKDVWFQYGSDLSPWVLKGVNLTIKRGETVAFVGRSGSGKTTLVQLINLLYRPTRGSIFIDGKDISTLPLGLVRDSVGIVMQDSNLFAGTIIDNITFGSEGGSVELAMAAARVANAHGFVSQQKGGYQARVDEGGRGLSGGQRQRINIARALYRRPSILILDEATSALDSESERAVVDAMKVFCRGRTSIIIAHRLSTILHADRIVLLDNGRVIETGSHRELIRKGGAYAQLFGAQLAI